MPSLRMKEKDSIKCKEWERRRREKINDAFKNLSQLLPNYDPAKNIAKIDVLEKSTEFVKELRLSNSRLLSQQAERDEKCKLIKELQDEVNKLILRVKQLTTLLKQAKIAIPIGPHIKSLGKKKLKWSEKIGPENLENSESNRGCFKNTLDVAGPEAQTPSKVGHGEQLTEECSDNRSGGGIGNGTVSLISITNSSSISSIAVNSNNNIATTQHQQGPLKEPNLELPSFVESTEVDPPVSAVVPNNNGSDSVVATQNKTLSSPPPSIKKANETRANPRKDDTSNKSTSSSSVPVQPTSSSAPLPPLPMQTIILTSCPVPPIINQNHPQMVTRIALGPTRILPKPADGVLRKIAILPIRKPLPPKEKKRRNRKKKVQVVTAEAQVQTSGTKSNTSDMEFSNKTSSKESSDIQVEASGISGIKSGSDPVPVTDSNESNTKEQSKQITQVEIVTNDHESKDISGNSNNIEMQEIPPPVQDTTMEIDTPEIAEEVEISSSSSRTEILRGNVNSSNNNHTDTTSNTETPETPDEDIMEGELVTRVVTTEGDQSSMKSPDSVSANKTLLDISSSTTQVQALSNSESTNKSSCKNESPITTKEKTTRDNANNVSSKTYELRVIEASEVERNIIHHQPSSLVDERLNTPNPDPNLSTIGDESVTGDKISECIARSIDLIDAPDGELMELADNWGDVVSTVNSPKSPISPTQMFLNMFPLLPRESIVSVSEGSHHHHQQGQGGSGKSSSFPYRSSFYIDSMLPDDPPPPNQIPVSSEMSNSSIHKNNSQSSATSIIPALPTQPSGSTSSSSCKSSIPTMTSSNLTSLLAAPTSTATTSNRPPAIATTISTTPIPSCSLKSTTLPLVPSSPSVKPSTQKSTTTDNSNLLTKSTLKSKISQPETKENKNPQASVLPTSSSTTSFLSDFNLFPEPTLDFGNFHHLSLSQISLTEDLFREVSRMRNPPAECQQSSAPTTTCISNSTSLSNSNSFQQFDFGNQFHPHYPQQIQNKQNLIQTSADSNNQYSIPDMTNNSSGGIIGAESSSARSQPNKVTSHLESQQGLSQGSNQFYQPMNFTPSIPDFSHQPQNSNVHTPRYDFNNPSESNYSNNIRQNSYNVNPFAQEQNTQQPSQKSAANNKHQLFRPQDFNNQTSISGNPHNSSTHRSNNISQGQPPSQSSQPSSVVTYKPSQSSSISNSKQIISSSSRIVDSQGIPQGQDQPRKQQNISNSQSNNCQSFIHQSYSTPSIHPTQSNNKEPSKQQQYRSTIVSNEKQSTTRTVSSKDQQSKSYTKSQTNKNSESTSSSSSRKSSSTNCQSNRRTNQASASSSGTNQNQPCLSQNVPTRLPEPPTPNQFPLINNGPLPIPSFPDFSITSNFHQQYETSFHPPPHYQHQHHSSSSSNNTPAVSLHPQLNPSHQQQRKSTSSSARHTPFYLQDVNPPPPPPCEVYNYPNSNGSSNSNIAPQAINLNNPVHSSPHHHPNHHHGIIHGTSSYNSSNNVSSSSQLKPPPSSNNNNNYPSSNPSTSAQPPLHHSQIQPNYFTANPSSQNTPTMYPSGGYSHQISPSSSSSSSARTHQQHEQVNYNLNANSTTRNNVQQSNNSSSSQQSKISNNNIGNNKSAATSSSNQNSYPGSGEQSSNNSSRPVNWMTTDTSSRTNNSKHSSQKTPANPFSVSKLVGNPSGQPSAPANTTNNNSNSSSKPNNSSNVPSMVSSSVRCTNNANTNNNASNSQNTSNSNAQNSSYCAESLIRKNPSSSSNNSNNNQSWSNLNFTQIQQQNQHHHSLHPHHQHISNATAPPYEIPNDQFNFSGYQTTNFPQHNSHQYNASHNTASESGGGSSTNNSGGNNNSNPSGSNPSSVQGNNIYGGSPFASHHQDQQQQQHHSQQHHIHQSSSQYHHHFSTNSNHHHLHQHHGTTSSVSNFNLSSIFPEINDKRGGGNNTNNSSSNNNNAAGAGAGGSNNAGNNTSSQNSANSSNSCNYYATVHSRK